MAGLANLLYLGQPDPAQQLAALLSGQQPQGAPPQGPAPPSGGTPTPAGGAAAAPNPSPGAPPPPNSPPQPQAFQSTPDMAQSYQTLSNPPNIMNLMLQMQQREQAMQGFNHGLALIAANHAGNPQSARAIMDSVGGGSDAGGTVNNLMSLYGAQNQMAAQQQLLAQAPAIAAKLGMDEATVRAEIMAGRGPELIKGLEPTEMARNYNWARDTYAKNHPGASPDDIEQGAQGILMGMGGGGGDSATRSWRAAKIQWDQNPATKGTPYPWGAGAEDNPTSFASWQGAQKVEETKQTEDQQEAAGKLPTYVQNLTGARKKLTDILGVTGYDDQGPSHHRSRPGSPPQERHRQPLRAVLRQRRAWGGARVDGVVGSSLSPAQKQVLNDIKEATDKNTLIGGLGKRAPKRGAADVNDITSGLSGMHDVTKNYGHWVQGALDTIGSIDKATGNAYGASGQADQRARERQGPDRPDLPLWRQTLPEGLAPAADPGRPARRARNSRSRTPTTLRRCGRSSSRTSAPATSIRRRSRGTDMATKT